MPRSTLGLLCAVVVATALLAGGAIPVPAAGTTVLTIAGTGDSQELLREVANRFMRDNPDIKVEVPDSIGSSGGIKAVLAGQAGLARTARPLRDAETAAGMTERVFAQAPIVFAVNPSITGVRGLTPAQALGIFSGKITNWSEVGGAPRPIHRVCRETPETSRDVLNTAIPGFAQNGCQGQAVAYATPEAVDMVAQHPGAIGYFGRPAMTGTTLKVLALGGVTPTPENLGRGDYPLSIPLALAYKPPLSPAASRFLAFLALPDARGLLTMFGCLPLTATGAVP